MKRKFHNHPQLIPCTVLAVLVTTVVLLSLSFGAHSLDEPAFRIRECYFDPGEPRGKCASASHSSTRFLQNGCGIVYTHLFKTAGTSFGHFLTKWGAIFHSKRTLQYTDWYNRNVGRWNSLDRADFLAETRAAHRDIAKRYGIIWGHMMNTNQEYFDCSASITILREPVKVIVSAALFEYRRQRSQIGTLSLEAQKEILWKYIRESPRFVQASDEQVYYVRGIQQIAGRKMYRGGNVSQLVQDATDKLQQYSLVGIASDLHLVESTFIRLFDGVSCEEEDEHLNSPCTVLSDSSRRRNESPRHMSTTALLRSLRPDELKYLEQLAAAELQLYERARALWQQTLCEIWTRCT